MKNIFKYLLLLGVLIVAPLVSSKAHADIYCSYPDTGYIIASGIVTIDNSVPNGTMVGSISGSTPDTYGYGCSGTGAAIKFYGTGASVPGYDNTYYQTSIPGLAYRIYAFTAAGCISGYYPLYCPYYNYSPGLYPRDFTIYFYKIGSIPAGGTLNGEFAHVDTYGSGGYYTANMAIFYWSSSIQVKVVNPTCTVSTPSINVPLPDTPITAFGGIGTTAGAAQNFNIMLNCSGGSAGASTRINVTLTDATNPANTTDKLSPTAATAGTGVGVRIYNGATPVRYGPDSNAVGNTNQWQVTTVNSGSNTVTIPLTATYVQVGSTVQGGAVKALATFTFAYN